MICFVTLYVSWFEQFLELLELFQNFSLFLDIDNLISINGMVVRTSNIIPEMSQGKLCQWVMDTLYHYAIIVIPNFIILIIVITVLPLV